MDIFINLKLTLDECIYTLTVVSVLPANVSQINLYQLLFYSQSQATCTHVCHYPWNGQLWLHILVKAQPSTRSTWQWSPTRLGIQPQDLGLLNKQWHSYTQAYAYRSRPRWISGESFEVNVPWTQEPSGILIRCLVMLNSYVHMSPNGHIGTFRCVHHINSPSVFLHVLITSCTTYL